LLIVIKDDYGIMVVFN